MVPGQIGDAVVDGLPITLHCVDSGYIISSKAIQWSATISSPIEPLVLSLIVNANSMNRIRIASTQENDGLCLQTFILDINEKTLTPLIHTYKEMLADLEAPDWIQGEGPLVNQIIQQNVPVSIRVGEHLAEQTWLLDRLVPVDQPDVVVCDFDEHEIWITGTSQAEIVRFTAIIGFLDIEAEHAQKNAKGWLNMNTILQRGQNSSLAMDPHIGPILLTRTVNGFDLLEDCQLPVIEFLGDLEVLSDSLLESPSKEINNDGLKTFDSLPGNQVLVDSLAERYLRLD